ncbi:hypothetical protein VNO80_14986 [Phaseolus coccineus]|uniref:K+ potassium transporter integral membrane domain-containing protein n=1 Tax=Phaseolus coccineus TaxID=3886 RepID=A0AAN9MJD6_PHACN
MQIPSLCIGGVLGTSTAILICLFMVQRFGTDEVGTEALFADVGHFTIGSLQISMCSVAYPALVLVYTGQASFLRKNNDLVSDTFYKSIPHTSVLPLKNTIVKPLIYLSSVLYKFIEGGYLPLFAAVLMTIMCIWHDVYRRKYYNEVDHEKLTTGKNLARMHGLATYSILNLFKAFHPFSSIMSHSVVVSVSIKTLPISNVPAEERFLFRQVEHEELCVSMYRQIRVH